MSFGVDLVDFLTVVRKRKDTPRRLFKISVVISFSVSEPCESFVKRHKRHDIQFGVEKVFAVVRRFEYTENISDEFLFF